MIKQYEPTDFGQLATACIKIASGRVHSSLLSPRLSAF